MLRSQCETPHQGFLQPSPEPAPEHQIPSPELWWSPFAFHEGSSAIPWGWTCQVLENRGISWNLYHRHGMVGHLCQSSLFHHHHWARPFHHHAWLLSSAQGLPRRPSLCQRVQVGCLQAQEEEEEEEVVQLAGPRLQHPLAQSHRESTGQLLFLRHLLAIRLITCEQIIPCTGLYDACSRWTRRAMPQEQLNPNGCKVGATFSSSIGVLSQCTAVSKHILCTCAFLPASYWQYVCVYVYICIYKYFYLFIYIYIYIYIYVCVYIYT